MHVSRTIPAFLALLAIFPLIQPSRADGSIERLKEAALQATSSDDAQAKPAIAALRMAGPAGLAALLNANADAVQRHRNAIVALALRDDAAWQRLTAAIDAVAAQKDAYASGLYWYTDIDAAKSAARASGKPILSLRLLGTLDSEFSCANSRFFRTALYANQQVQQAMREGFVLHWQSVRPVPKITIDFGDGRVVERTITGNSIHYVLDAGGRVIDAIPGLYGPKSFIQKLSDAAGAESSARAMPQSQRDAFLRTWHDGQASRILTQWRADLSQAGVSMQPSLRLAFADTNLNEAVIAARTSVALTTSGQPSFNYVPPPMTPTAIQAAPRALGKAKVETPVVFALVLPQPNSVTPATLHPLPPIQTEEKTLEQATDDAAWQKLAELHWEDARLDAGSRALIVVKNPDAAMANLLTMSKSAVETPLVRMVQNFERSIAADSVRNEYTFHRQIHGWLASGPQTAEGKLASDVNALNERVYAELFLTPSADPWLGLMPPDTYSALPNDGVCKK
jgi:hypothetical protein